MLAIVLLAGMLGIVGYGLATGGGFSAKIARLTQRRSRPGMIFAWAGGTAVSYGVSSIVALTLLGRGTAVAIEPPELRDIGERFGIVPIEGVALAWTAACLSLGAAIGIAIVVIRQRLGRQPIALRYRSPAAARDPGDRFAAAALALSAGVSEEMFFRLALPLLIAVVTGSALAGLGVAWLAFTALHRHQGWVGMAAVALVGAALAYLYLLTGRLWVVIVLHVVIDLNALVLRPLLTRALNSSAATPS